MRGESTLAYIREHYGVPATVGQRIEYKGKPGVIVGGASGGAYLMVKLDGNKHAETYHPTFDIKYVEAE